MNAGRLIARLTIGGLFIGHGTQKLFGWFGGPGPEGTEQMMDKLELRPARRNALAAGISETAGGALLTLGALTPVAGALLSGTMFTAIRKVHRKNGPWNTNRGYEYNLVLIAALANLVDGGPGPLSLDRALGIDRTGSGWALASVAAGAAGSALAIEAGAAHTARQTAPPHPQPQRNGRPQDVSVGALV
jgi:putative oxidoreductase